MALEPSDLTTISDFFRGCRKVKNFIKDKEGYAKTLSAYGENKRVYTRIFCKHKKC